MTRPALQHQYTSCKRGHLGSPGFQTRTCTEGLRPDEQREIERRGTYTPPRSAKQDPTREEIDQEFPRIFRYYALESGRWALTYSCYVGQDYSGRWGNYFAHSLIGDDGAPPLWPIDYYEWKGWKTSLSPEEDTEETPLPLPAVDLTSVPPSPSFTFAELKEFLREVPGRASLLADMLRAVFLRTETSRALVIRDTFLNGLFWIACLQKAVPHSCLKEFSFSTYQYDDRNCATVNATIEGTDFQFNEAQRQYQFFMFDFANGEYSEVPKANLDYSHIVAEWMANEPERLEAFHNFVSLFDCQKPDGSLVWAAFLFLLNVGDNPPISADQIPTIIDFVSRFTLPQAQDQIVELMAKLTPALCQAPVSDAYEALIRFFAEVARSNGKPRPRLLAFAAWITMFDNLVFLGGSDTERVSTMRVELLKSFGNCEHELAALFLSPEHMKAIGESLSERDPNVLEEILKVVRTSLHVLSRTPVWEQPEAKRLISAIVSSRDEPYRSALRVFNLVTPDTNGIVEICGLLAANSKTAAHSDSAMTRRIEIGRALRAALAELPEDLGLKVREQLCKPDTWDILYGEWLALLSTTEDKRELYGRYVRMSGRYLPKYLQKYGEHLDRSLLKVLPADQQSQQAMQWVANGHLEDLSETFITECMRLANLDVPFDLRIPNALKNASRLSETARKYGVRLTPDRPFLLKMISMVERGDVQMMELPLDDIQKILSTIDGNSYTVFLANFLRNALSRAKLGREHYRIVSTVYIQTHFDRFKHSYLEFLQDRVKKPFTLSDEAALVFWLARLWRGRSLTALEDLTESVLSLFSERIIALSDDQYQKLNAHMWDRGKELGGDFEGWKWLGNQRGSRHGSLLPRFRRRI
jgi:hypothetical protein